ncbi:FtsX-like permease family protein [Anseongella ginsenosidimutans]|uniref:FtsX-like permease family protein n=1 Tax=Anseongella ginsenosidimutans TaxID=496056 RepID=UPI001CEF8A61|nr:FtsX-like permease family protein [Anseongella ginsenosidimutans]
MIYAILGIAFFILLIAGINFINLNVARSFTRAREVGVRKSLGALKSQLFVQIWGEAAMICVAGFLVGGLLAWLLLPQYNALFQAPLNPSWLFSPGFAALMLGVLALLTLAAGGYPAWQLSRFNPVEVLKGKVSLKRPGLLRNSLIVMQFAMASLLICCTITAARQVNYLRKQPLGFEKEQVISIPVGSKVDGRQALGRMRNMLANDPQIQAITGTGVNLGIGRDRSSTRSVISFNYKGQEVSTDWLLVDYEYLKTLDIELLAGREFDPAFPADADHRVIISESLAQKLGMTDPVGKFFQTDTGATPYQVIGLVPDFHLYSLANKVQPITMHFSNEEAISYIFVRVSPQSLAGSMDKLKQAWKEAAPRSEFLGSFLNENIDAQYRDEERLSQVFGFASGIAILLSCLGLFAVALMVIEQRTKEIGVRKVLGASIPGIIMVLSHDFMKLVLAALLIAIPAAWFFMQQWLNNYPYRVEMSLGVFVLTSLAILLIALLTISFQSIRAALMNPVRSLRSE